MCCFSQPVEIVAETSIFARAVRNHQFLVYSMKYAASSDLAMVLPLPVPPNSPDDAVEFIDLHGYREFFEDLRREFPPRMTAPRRAGGAKMKSLERPPLKIHDVGDFEASFVPRIADFDRLDERFRLPAGVWESLPHYHDFGFAVFKLKATNLRGVVRQVAKILGLRRMSGVHPMALKFPRRNPKLLYFPTFHVHDERVHPYATFDHMLYCQTDDVGDGVHDLTWERSVRRASSFMAIDRCKGIVDPDAPCLRHPLEGRLENKDSYLGKGESLPRFAGMPR